MPDWVIWVIAAGVLAVGEMASLSFFLGPIAVAAAIAALAALAGAGLALQLVVFIAASMASLAVLRPIARRHTRMPGQIRTGTKALIGARAVAIERIDSEGGSVKLDGEVWSARTYDEEEAIEPGQRVQVIEIEGATALVSDGIG